MAQPYVGEIILFAGTFPPLNYALCNGQLLSISSNETLFTLLGTTYGGDGVNTFGLPDLRGRLALHAGTARSGTTYVLGEATGSETVALNTNQLPSHSHVPNCSTGTGNAASPSNAVWAQSPVPSGIRGGQYSTSASNATMAAAAIGNSTGTGSGHPNIQPILALNFCIALYGIYPTQN